MTRKPPAPALRTLAISGDVGLMSLEGVLDIRTLMQAEQALHPPPGGKSPAKIDVSGLSSVDTSGALLLCRLRDEGVQLTGIGAAHKTLLELVGGLKHQPIPEKKAAPRWHDLIARLGRAADNTWREAAAVTTFIGRTAGALGQAVIHPGSLRPASISRHIAEAGIDALPIIGVMAVMISIVIGYQAIAQLRPYGGEDLMIDLVAISMLREMGVLMTAIMVAGRSGASFTAEIGVMKAREEIDALTIMGLDPMAMLVVPRLIALVITLPLLTFFADVMGLVGGGIIARTFLQVSPDHYLERVHEALNNTQLFVGLVKAPVFGFVIAVVGCMHGLRVQGSAESVGRETTRAVVKSIFLVIVLDGLFSILFERLGL
jgi:phospholipid/cholesterol/gamma-HCH transport system permease protein